MKEYMSLNQFQELCIKDLAGNISESERKELHYLIDESEEFKIEYENLKKVWINAELEETNNLPDIDNEWVLLNNRIKVNENSIKTEIASSPKSRIKFSSLFAPKYRAITVSVFIILLFVIGIYQLTDREILPDKEITVNSLNEHKSIQLPDGSTVLLNKNSEIKYLEKFSTEQREVKLEGEAFFSVTKDNRTFSVITGNAKTTVLGTKFNVYTNNEKTEVFVKEGKVNLKPKRENFEGVVLTQNELSRIIKSENPSSPEKIDPEYMLDWIEGRIVFTGTPLNKVVEKLERYYNKSITLNDKNLSGKLTGTFENKNLDSVLAMVCLALELEYEKQNNNYILKSKNNNDYNF